MKRLIGYMFLLAAAVLSLQGCTFLGDKTSPERFVKHCVRLMDKRALYADTPEWKEAKAEALSCLDTLSDMDAARAVVQKAVKVAGGKHSFLSAPVRDTASYPEYEPEVKLLEGGVAYIKLPAHSGVKVPDSLYVAIVYDFLEDHRDAAGVVVDLRGNRGGNMYPMIAAVSPLLPDGTLLSFKSPKGTMPIPQKFVLLSARISPGSLQRFPESTPVALLTDDWTASSGEATLLCFRGLPNAKSFGAPTAGYASANVPLPLPDGWQLVLTTSCDLARTGEIFCDDPIAPDVPTDTPLEDALEWISGIQ